MISGEGSRMRAGALGHAHREVRLYSNPSSRMAWEQGCASPRKEGRTGSMRGVTQVRFRGVMS